MVSGGIFQKNRQGVTLRKSDLLRKLTLLDFVNLQWWELATFMEIGRGTPEWGFDELHVSMKSDISLSFRVMANNDIGRLDPVRSIYDATTWLIYGHPF